MYCQLIAESTEVETHLSIKLSKKNFGGILRPKSVTRTLNKGLMRGPRVISSLISVMSLLDFARPSIALRQLIC